MKGYIYGREGWWGRECKRRIHGILKTYKGHAGIQTTYKRNISMIERELMGDTQGIYAEYIKR